MSMSYLNIEDVSKRMHISVGTARNRLSRGQPMPPSIKIGRRRLFREDIFDQWMENYLTRNDGIKI